MIRAGFPTWPGKLEVDEPFPLVLSGDAQRRLHSILDRRGEQLAEQFIRDLDRALWNARSGSVSPYPFSQAMYWMSWPAPQRQAMRRQMEQLSKAAETILEILPAPEDMLALREEASWVSGSDDQNPAYVLLRRIEQWIDPKEIWDAVSALKFAMGTSLSLTYTLPGKNSKLDNNLIEQCCELLRCFGDHYGGSHPISTAGNSVLARCACEIFQRPDGRQLLERAKTALQQPGIPPPDAKPQV
jgi:hypothetical protein